MCGRPCSREDGHDNLHRCSMPSSATHQPPRGVWWNDDEELPNLRLFDDAYSNLRHSDDTYPNMKPLDDYDYWSDWNDFSGERYRDDDDDSTKQVVRAKAPAEDMSWLRSLVVKRNERGAKRGKREVWDRLLQLTTNDDGDELWSRHRRTSDALTTNHAGDEAWSRRSMSLDNWMTENDTSQKMALACIAGPTAVSNGSGLDHASVFGREVSHGPGGFVPSRHQLLDPASTAGGTVRGPIGGNALTRGAALYSWETLCGSAACRPRCSARR